MKQFVNALDKDDDRFNYIAQTCPGLSMEKLEASIFGRPEIRKLMQDQTFAARVTVVERAAWCSYVSVIRDFLGNTKASSYPNLVDVMLQNVQALGARMSIKLHYLAIQTISQRILVMLTGSKGRGSINTLGTWKKDTKVIRSLT